MLSAGLSPELLDGLKNVRVNASEKVELKCRISPGDPTADVQWYRNGRCCKIFRKIFNDGKYEIIGDMMSLTIAESEESDGATYRCEAVNKFGTVRTECIVVVLRMFHARFVNIYSVTSCRPSDDSRNTD